MSDDSERDLEIVRRIHSEVGDLERQASEVLERIEILDQEGELRTRLILMKDPGLADRVPERYLAEELKPAPDQLTRSDLSLAEGGPKPRREVVNSIESRRTDGRRSSKKPARVSHESMVKWCQAILQEEGGEMHVSAIRKKLEENPEWRVPGQGTDSNVSVHLARSKDFRRGKRRGTWRLVEQRSP